MNAVEVKSCRACSSKLPEIPVFSLGNMPIVDFPASADDPVAKAPINLLECPECSLVQLSHSVDREFLFRHFWYKSGITRSMKNALASVANNARRMADLREGDWVLDIGTNDGTLLEYYPDYCFKAGFEPAANVAEEAEKKGFSIVQNFFSAEHLPREWNHRFKIITAVAMFYDVDELADFFTDVRLALRHDGIFVVQMNYLADMLDNLAVDNIEHEHLTYFSAGSFVKLAESCGFSVVSIDGTDINGGSIRFTCRPSGRTTSAVQEFVGSEFLDWNGFTTGLEQVKCKLRSYFMNSKPHAICGASTRGLATLHFLQLGKDQFCCAGERDPGKFGRFYGDTGIPIVSEVQARKVANSFLVLPWHFAKEITEREQEFLDGGGELVFPLPKPRVVTANGERFL